MLDSVYKRNMIDTNPTGKHTDLENYSELQSERWAVVSFDQCEASGLTYAVAMQRMAELEERRIAGLCIVTDEAAARLNA